jgi:superfamily I DNA and/or RNA helicase
VPVVGVTCCSALLSALDGQAFDVVVLDECSQMVEPLSLVPLIRAKCR